MNYNFLFFFPVFDYYKTIYSDLHQEPNVCLHFGINPPNKILNLFSRVHLSERINKIINLPFKTIWYPALYSTKRFKDSTNKLCFVFWAHYIESDYFEGFITHLRKKHRNAKFVFFYTNPLNSSFRKKLTNPSYLKNIADLIFTYDQNDAQNYGFEYFPTSFSDVKVANNKAIASSDVCFIGKNKGRYSLLLDIYKQLTDNGYICDFYVTDVKETEKKSLSGISYIPLTYNEYLQHIKKTRIILELQQNGAIGATLRTWEAINFGKGLLTNNTAIIQSKYYDRHYVSIFDEKKGIDMDFIANFDHYENPLKEDIRPYKMLEFINSYLNKHE